MQLKIFNSLSRVKEVFTPSNPSFIGMYVCGPTVYDHPHIGNARSVVVYDLLYRVLIYLFGNNSVKYVRNITDIDDKINAKAKEMKIDIKTLTTITTEYFQNDIKYLNCLSPKFEPKATEHLADMINIIEKLITRGHAYLVNDHVYFDISSFENYTNLSGRSLDEMISGARTKIEESKKNPEDFVLWKPADSDDDPSAIFDSPWGFGRPGWHIECSAMSNYYLGEDFDIHGGGADLIFPHHTNEIAQSCCAFEGSRYAKFWVHNGFVTVNGEKMSKSLGNFLTVKDLREQGIKGEIIRYMLLSTHYRKPLDFSQKSLDDAKISLDYLYRSIEGLPDISHSPQLDEYFLEGLLDDLNISHAFAYMHELAKRINKETDHDNKILLQQKLKSSGQFLGFFTSSNWFERTVDDEINLLIEQRDFAKKEKNWQVADEIRNILLSKDVIIEDTKSGTIWRKK